MHADEAAFLAAIEAAPAEVAPRLVYADWLDEHGQPGWAAFLRAQCELALTPASDPAYRERLSHARTRLGDLGPGRQELLPRFPGVTYQWAESPGLLWGEFAMYWRYPKHAAAVFAGAPVQGLRFFNLNDGQCEMLAGSPYLSRITHLDLSRGPIRDTGAVDLARSPYLNNLEELFLEDCRIEEWGMIELAGSLARTRVGRVELSGNPLSERARGVLAQRLAGRYRWSPAHP
jgi:uncharacterized protein (TIGR02996 family)